MTPDDATEKVPQITKYSPSSVPLDAMKRALVTADMARQMREHTQCDQFSTTFKMENGRLGGRVTWDAAVQDFTVDFTLIGQ